VDIVQFFVAFIGFLIYFLSPQDIKLEVVKAKYTDEKSKYMGIFYSNSNEQLQAHYKDEKGVIQQTSKESGCQPSEENGFCTLVLLHGISSSLHTWDGWVQQMLNYGFRLIRIDLPAFGITGHLPSHNYSIENDVIFIHEFLSKLESVPPKFCIVGNSLGGWIAINYLLKYKEQVAKLILIDSVGFLKEENFPIIFRFGRIPYLGHILKFFTPRFIFSLSVKDVFGDDSKITPELVDRYYELAIREGNREGLFSRIVGNATFLSLGETKEIKVPVLIMWGEIDAWIPVAHAHLFKEDILHAELKIYKGVGHCPMEELPFETSMDAIHFLTKTS